MAMNMLDNGMIEYRMFTRLRNTGATIPLALVPEENIYAILNSDVMINDPSNVRIDWRQLTPFKGEYVACADIFNNTEENKGKLFRAADPYFFWDRADFFTFVHRILGVKNASLSAIVKENGKYVFARTSDLHTWETGREVPDDFPRDGGFARLPGDNASWPLLLVGGINGPTYYDLKYLNTAWRSSDGLTWEKIASTQPPFPRGHGRGFAGGIRRDTLPDRRQERGRAAVEEHRLFLRRRGFVATRRKGDGAPGGI